MFFKDYLQKKDIMGLEAKNYEVISLSGTMTSDTLGNGITANTVHQIYCLAAGSISITAMGGGTFTWAPAAANISIDIVPSRVVVSSGTFIGFRTKNTNISYTPNAF